MEQRNAGVIVPPPLLWVVAAGLSLLLNRLWPLALGFSGSWVVGVVMALWGGLWVLWAFFSMNHVKTPVDPSKIPTALVIVGPYRWGRNPMYLAMLIWMAALGLLMRSWWPWFVWVPLWAVLRYGVIQHEENFLFRLFGQNYDKYYRRTRRWL